MKRLAYRRWFVKYVEGYTIRQLVEISGLSKSTICRVIERELSEPVPQPDGFEHVKSVVFDGKYLFGSKACLLMVFDAVTKQPVAGRIVQRESRPQIQPFLEELSRASMAPVAVTTDGNYGAIAAFKALWPDIVTQRCLFHIERQTLSWCRQKPIYYPARDLKEIVYGLTKIATQKQALTFVNDFHLLRNQHTQELNSYDPNHKVKGDILRAYSLITNAQNNMFHYLDNASITQTTNTVEGYFKQIQNIKGFRHNGLTRDHLTQLINWKIHNDIQNQ